MYLWLQDPKTRTILAECWLDQTAWINLGNDFYNANVLIFTVWIEKMRPYHHEKVPMLWLDDLREQIFRGSAILNTPYLEKGAKIKFDRGVVSFYFAQEQGAKNAVRVD